MSSNTAVADKKQELQGMRKNGKRAYIPRYLCWARGLHKYHSGKQWHPSRKAFRPASGLTSYEQRTKLRMATTAMKAKEKEMKDEKEAERQVFSTLPKSKYAW